MSAPKVHLSLMMLGRNAKKAIMVCADLLMLPMALWSAFALRLSEWWPEKYLAEALPLMAIVPVFGVFIFMRLGLYRAIVRFMGAQAILSVVKGVVLLAVSVWAVASILQISPFPRSVPIIFALAALVYVGGSRLLVRNYYHWLLKNYNDREAVLIYGAGGAGAQLANSLISGVEYIPVGFVDDNKAVAGSTLNGLSVYSPNDMSLFIEERAVSIVLLAMPSIEQKRRREILEQLANYKVHVMTVPSMPEIISGASVDALRDVEPEDLLARDPVPSNNDLMSLCVEGKSVLVSGAGGSIGSEICRQLVKSNPSIIVLYEMSEFGLYTIEKELNHLLEESGHCVSIYPILGSILDEKRINRVIRHFSINTIYHAAAYKHVPMVEHNVLEGIRNNSFGTMVIAQAALEHNVEHFVMVSTDKAVRPTNTMGATKRLAELIIQEISAQNAHTVFSIVRFGNVLGSSGSVVPLFRSQIEKGGPVTVTHPEITRFFMTIPEAASLVIQAGAMAEGGEVFVLDMGKPVKITELAVRMIRLMGLEIRSEENPDGVEVIYTGLRPGEKLFEELLIGGDVVGTAHPKIMRAQEEGLSAAKLDKVISSLSQAIDKGDSVHARELLGEVVSGFNPTTQVVDWLEYSKKNAGHLH